MSTGIACVVAGLDDSPPRAEQAGDSGHRAMSVGQLTDQVSTREQRIEWTPRGAPQVPSQHAYRSSSSDVGTTEAL